jgi:Tol biopolymer transport system component
MQTTIASRPRAALALSLALLMLATGCVRGTGKETRQPITRQGERWGIYRLALDTQEVELLYSSKNEISALRLDSVNDRFVFSEKVGGDAYENSEVFTVGIDGQNLQRLTDNAFWDLYPVWSPDGSEIAFLSWRESTLDIYIMDADGSNQRLLYDSGFHDADIHWVDDQITFTSQSQIWIMQQDGTNARQLTDPPRAGEWGNANLPFGDFDPRISPDSFRVLFSRMVGDDSPHGNYDLFTVNLDGSNLFRLTETGYSQGLSSWSHAGDKILYIVAAIEDVGQYDLYFLNADGTGSRNITPDTFPADFLIHWAIYSQNDTDIYFVGEWWLQP